MPRRVYPRARYRQWSRGRAASCVRPPTEGKGYMTGRWPIVIGVAAVGVMALGAQTVLAGGPVDSDPPDLQLSGKKKQKLGKGGPGQNCLSLRGKCGQPPEAVKVKASCDEACTASAEGKLTKVKNDKLRPSERVELRPHQTGDGP
jgi:hypothetical protein